MRGSAKALALVWLLLAGPAWALDLVKVATIPRGHASFAQLPVGDADHDGQRELYFTQSTGPFSLNVWEHWGNNSYQPVFIRTQGCGPAAVGDADQDGLSDLLCQWGPQAFLLESRTPTTFPSRKVWEEPLGGFPGIRGYFVDADQDGQVEIWIVPNDPNVIEVWENRGNNAYAQVALLTDPLMFPATSAFGDFDQDGRTEIVVGESGNFLHVWEAQGGDTYVLVWTFQLEDSSTEMVVAARDLDGDGKPEFLVSGQTATYGHAVTIFEASGDNTYIPVWQLRGPGSFAFTHVAGGDIDGDGHEEFAVAIPGAVQLYKAFGDNDFRLVGQVPYPPFQNPSFGGSAINVADLNGNGVDELIVLAPNTQQSYIYELDTLQPPVLITAWFPARYRTLPGWPLRVELELFNRTGAQRVVDAWVEVYQGAGEGGPQGPRIRQRVVLSQVALAPGVPLSHRVFLGGPPGPGPYTYQLKVGTFPTQVIDTRWFTVNRGVAPEGVEYSPERPRRRGPRSVDTPRGGAYLGFARSPGNLACHRSRSASTSAGPSRTSLCWPTAAPSP